MKELGEEVEEWRRRALEGERNLEGARQGYARVAELGERTAEEMRLISERCNKLRGSLLAREEELAEVRAELARVSEDRREL